MEMRLPARKCLTHHSAAPGHGHNRPQVHPRRQAVIVPGMKAVRCLDHQPRVVDIPPPTGPGVRVRVASAGICGSDQHLLATDLLAGTLGHEFAGRLDDGTPVAVEPLDPCLACAPCANGDYHLCVRGPALLLGVGRDGGMAEECLVPSTAIVRLPGGLPLRDASLVEPMAVAVHGLQRADYRLRDRVAVIGGGAIGQCVIAAVRAAGGRADLAARHEAQRAAGARLGGGEVHAGADSAYDLVVDAAGSDQSMAESIRLARPGARILVLAMYWSGLRVDSIDWCLKELKLVPAYLYGRRGAARDADTAAALLAADPAIAATVITHRFPLDAAADAFRVARDRAAGAIRVVLEP
jgi:threonine dehydrogenase-like Zn-dependent dehydrogenase